MKTLLFGLLFAPLPLVAQGVAFEQATSWHDVQARARASAKYILAEFCNTDGLSCKGMDQSVLSRSDVGAYVNSRFISVKLAGDTGAKKIADTTRLAADAQALMRDQKIMEFPTYLFFSPDGRLVHRGSGFKNPQTFLEVAAEAVDSTRQYYTLLAKYKEGKLDYSAMPYLARTAQLLKDRETARQVATTYIAHLTDAELYTKDNIELIRAFTIASTDRGFDLFYRRGARVDSLMAIQDYSRGVVDRVISREEFEPAVTRAKAANTSPDWDAIHEVIARKYSSDYADRTSLGAKVSWYQRKAAQTDWPTHRGEWSEYTRNLVAWVEQYGPKKFEGMAAFFLNNAAWDVFRYSSNKKELETALGWSDRVLKAMPNNGNNIDTYANLLYKLGRNAEAVKFEEQAAAIAPQAADIKATLEKMKRGEPTWP